MLCPNCGSVLMVADYATVFVKENKQAAVVKTECCGKPVFIEPCLIKVSAYNGIRVRDDFGLAF